VSALRNDQRGCKVEQTSCPTCVDACLRDSGLYDYLNRCADCSEQFTEMLTLIHWRETQEPFNRGVLPVSAMRILHLSFKGSSP